MAPGNEIKVEDEDDFWNQPSQISEDSDLNKSDKNAKMSETDIAKFNEMHTIVA